ncbi:MAG: flagellar biosynthetic protein FliO [Verrucomicrobiae bacterium]|nr:flagellar biosynthetic protein FliO [Verrucomicrobiae bacterium]
MDWFQLLLIALLYAALLYVWYAVKTKQGIGLWLRKNVQKKEIHVVECISLGARTSLYLIEVRNQSMLLVASPSGNQIINIDNNNKNSEVEPQTSRQNKDLQFTIPD